MNERSIFSVSIGNDCSDARLECPVPKSSTDSETPCRLSSES
jgi:hypothetical protein